MSDIVKWKPNAEVDRRIEQAMELLGKSVMPNRAVTNRPVIQAPVRKVAAPPPVALPRSCGIDGRPFAAYYYPERNGHHRHSNTGIVSQQVFRASFCGTNEGASVSSDDIEDEACPLCGVSGLPIHCRRCDNWQCCNRLVNNFFTCVICGASGKVGVFSGVCIGFQMK